VGRVISVRLSDLEEMRIRGAAAITGLSISAYLKWLVIDGRTGTQNHTEMILRSLDDIRVAIANLGSGPREERVAPVVGLPARSAIVSRLKERGIPSSTIRQMEAVLDDLERDTTRMNTDVNKKSQTQQ
jgi:hypothetical protein